MKSIINRNLLGISMIYALLMGGSTVGFADDINLQKMSGGVQTDFQDTGVDAYFEVQLGSEIWTVKAEFATDGSSIPRFQIRVVPFNLVLGEPGGDARKLPEQERNATWNKRAGEVRKTLKAVLNREPGLSLAFFPLELERNQSIGRDFGLRVSAIGVSYPIAKQAGSWVLFAQLAADAVAYKMLEYKDSVDDDYKGFDLATADVLLGATRALGEMFTVTVTLGGRADIGLGDSNGFSVNSDLKAYLRATGGVGGLLQMWAEIAQVAGYDSGNRSFDSATMFTTGITFYY